MSTTPTLAPNPPLALPAGLSPDALDILTELSAILARLRTPAAPAAAGGLGSTGQTPAAAPTPSSRSQILAGGDITPQNLPVATDNLKHKLLKARAAIRTLPDMDRTADEQDAEIAELEAKIVRQRRVLDDLKTKGIEFAARGQVGDRMEE